MDLLSDALLVSAAFCAGVYCIIVSRRLGRFVSQSDGIAVEIKKLSHQVEELNGTLQQTLQDVDSSSETLARNLEKGEAAKQSLELLLASLHDLPSSETQTSGEPVFVRRVQNTPNRFQSGSGS